MSRRLLPTALISICLTLASSSVSAAPMGAVAAGADFGREGSQSIASVGYRWSGYYAYPGPAYYPRRAYGYYAPPAYAYGPPPVVVYYPPVYVYQAPPVAYGYAPVCCGPRYYGGSYYVGW